MDLTMAFFDAHNKMIITKRNFSEKRFGKNSTVTLENSKEKRRD